MLSPNAKTSRILVFAVVSALWMGKSLPTHGQDQPENKQSGVVRAVGTVKTIQGSTITITADSGSDLSADISSSTRLLRVPPGEKDLKNATPLTMHDLQPGDRVLVRGQSSADGRSIAALAVIVMKRADVNEKQSREKADWQKRGIGGLVTAVNLSQGTITISSGSLRGNHDIVVHTTKDTVLRRYPPNSIKFDDAKPALLDQIKMGDQLLARGESSVDGNSLTADEVVSGTFRNIAGTVASVNPADNTLTVQDLIKKGTVLIKISSDSQVKKIPGEMAQRIAMRLKATTGEGNGASGDEGNHRAPAGGSPNYGPGMQRNPGMQGGRPGGGAPDLQRMLSRLPSSTLSDLQKGDAVMVVSTMEEGSGGVTAITLLAGVEPILAAAPTRNASATLSAWTLGGLNPEAGAEP